MNIWTTLSFHPDMEQFFLPPRISSTDTGLSTSQTTCTSISEHLRKSLSSNSPLNWGVQILGQAEKSASHLQRFQTWAGKRRDTWEWQNPGWKVPAWMRKVNNYLIYSNCYFIPKTIRQIVFSSNIGDANLSHPKIYSHEAWNTKSPAGWFNIHKKQQHKISQL